MTPYSSEVEQQMRRFYGSLNERDRRRYAAIEAVKLGWGGMSYIQQLLHCDYYTLQLGISELSDNNPLNQDRVRSKGGGRKRAIETIAGLEEAFLKVIAEHTAGSPMDATVKWTNLTRQEIAQLMAGEGIEVSVTVVDQLLEQHNYRKRKAQKRLATGEHPQRNEQFEKIAQLKQTYTSEGNPVLSMDTKKEN